MLTIKSNLNNFRDRQGEGYTPEDLDLLCKALIKSDIINFPIKKEMSAGFTSALAWKIAERIKLVETGKYLVINDISLQVANVLVSLGVNPKNIYLAYGKWTKKAEPDTDPTLYLLMKQYLKANIVETFTVIKLEEIFTLGTKFDGIIANPPYGKIGAQITEKIKDKIDYEQFINLLPANDYKRIAELYNYIFNITTFKAGTNFADAYVTTHLVEVSKTKVNNLTSEEFERQQFVDSTLDKYFKVLFSRTHYAIDNAMYKPTFEEFNNYGVERAIYIGKRDPKSEHLPYSKTSITTRFNNNQITNEEVIAKSAKSEQKYGRVGDFYLIGFDTEEEKTNCSAFLYSTTGFRFISKVFVALNIDSSIPVRKWMPKVDWTRTWTVEELLADYGYTEAEIAEVMTDLENFKDMGRD